MVRLELIANHIIPFDDSSFDEVWKNGNCDFVVCDSKEMLIDNAEIVMLALPTDLDLSSGGLNLQCIQDTIAEILEHTQNVTIKIRSTVSVGFTKKMQEKFDYNDILCMPEFLREGKAYTDIVNPNRVRSLKEIT